MFEPMNREDTLERYIQALIDRRVAGLLNVFSQTAVLEDSYVVSGVVRGRQDILVAYEPFVKDIQKVDIESALKVSHGLVGTVVLKIYKGLGELAFLIKTLDILTFDNSGKIAHLKSYWKKEPSLSTEIEIV